MLKKNKKDLGKLWFDEYDEENGMEMEPKF